RAQVGKPPHGLRPGAAAELEQAALEVHLDRARAEKQALADLLAVIARGDEQHDLQLAAGQSARRASPADLAGPAAAAAGGGGAGGGGPARGGGGRRSPRA